MMICMSTGDHDGGVGGGVEVAMLTLMVMMTILVA